MAGKGDGGTRSGRTGGTIGGGAADRNTAKAYIFKALTCAATMAVIYGVLLSVDEKEVNWLYCTEVAAYALSGLLAANAIFSFWNGIFRKGLACLAGAVLMQCLSDILMGKGIVNGLRWEVQKLTVSAWPFLLLMLAGALWKMSARMKKWALWEILYFVVVLFGIWLLENPMIPWESSRWETVQTCYLFLMGDVVYCLLRKTAKEDKRQALNRTAAAVGMNLLTVFVLISQNIRVRTILYSLGIECARGSDNMQKIDWIDYRMEALESNLTRNLPYGYNYVMGWRNPIAFLNIEYGVFVPALVCVLFGICLAMLAKLPCPSEKIKILKAVVCISLSVQGVFGVICDLFLIGSSRVVFPMLGVGINTGASTLAELVIFLQLAYQDEERRQVHMKSFLGGAGFHRKRNRGKLDQIVLNLESDFGLQLRFAGIDDNCLQPKVLEDRKIIRNYPCTLLKNYPDISYCETADGIRFLRIRFNVPTFDSGDREYDSWHTLYLIQKRHRIFDAVYAKGGYRVVSVKGYKGLLEMPEALAELPLAKPLYTRKAGERFQYTASADEIVYSCAVNDNNSAVSICKAEQNGRDSRRLVIPEQIEHYPIEMIEKTAFAQLGGIESIKLPKSLYRLENGIFDRCGNLRKIYVSSGSRQYMSKDGVLYSKDEKMLLRFPPGRDDDCHCITDGVEEIGAKAFANCKKIRKITVADSVRKICNSAFENCTALSSIIISGQNEAYSVLDGSVYTKTGAEFVYFPCALGKKKVKIAEGTVFIRKGAFADGFGIEEIMFPDTIGRIDKEAFGNKLAVRTVYLPKTEFFRKFADGISAWFGQDAPEIVWY